MCEALARRARAVVSSGGWLAGCRYGTVLYCRYVCTYVCTVQYCTVHTVDSFETGASSSDISLRKSPRCPNTSRSTPFHETKHPSFQQLAAPMSYTLILERARALSLSLTATMKARTVQYCTVRLCPGENTEWRICRRGGEPHDVLQVLYCTYIQYLHTIPYLLSLQSPCLHASKRRLLLGLA